jgi:hypothetical protein
MISTFVTPVNEFRFLHYGLDGRKRQDEECVENVDKTDYNGLQAAGYRLREEEDER